MGVEVRALQTLKITTPKGCNFLQMETEKKRRGGARAGAGRPRSFAGGVVPVGIGLSREEGARLRHLAQVEGLTLGQFVARLMDYYEGHPIPESRATHPIPETPDGGHIPDINPKRL